MVLYNPQDAEPLTTWLVKNLDAISDAEPLALAKYILELLSMWSNDPESEQKVRLVEELTEFLQKEAAPFVDRLLGTLRSKSYLPYVTESEPPPNAAPRNRQQGSRKRGLEQDDQERAQEKDLKGPPKGPRLHNERQSRRYDSPKDRGHGQRFQERDGHGSRSNPPNMEAQGSRQDSDSQMFPSDVKPEDQRERCRDYYELGFCNRGVTCPYSHGNDAMFATAPLGAPPLPFPGPIPPAMAMQLLNGLFPPGWGPNFMGAMSAMGPMGPDAMPYDPLNAQFGPPMQPFNMSANGSYDSAIQDLTPRGPRGNRQPPNQQQQAEGRPGPGPRSTDDNQMMEGHQGGPQPNNAMDVGMESQHHNRNPSFGRGGRGFRGRGGRPDRTHRTNVVDPNALTIVVEKLPPEKTNISELTNWFSKFGTVTNVAVDTRGNRALVSFASHDEAHAAWKSEEAVFGNRFVVIFWHRPAPGGGTAGQKALEASATTIQKLNAAAAHMNGDSVGEDTTMESGEQENGKIKNGHAHTESKDIVMGNVNPTKLKSPQDIYEYASRVWMEKMKGVMDIMQSNTATEQEKQEAKAKFKVLKSQKPTPPTAPSGPAPSQDTNSSKTDLTTGNKEDLDIDIDMLASGKASSLTQEEAQQALARLQELAAERGLDPNAMESDSYGHYRGSRGRGRRGGFVYRGRGRGRGAAIALANASLDNRTKRIILRGYDQVGVSDADALDMAQGFYLPTGLAEEVTKGPDGGIVVSFADRMSAELAIRAGPPDIEGLGNLSMQWYNVSPAESKSAPGPSETQTETQSTWNKTHAPGSYSREYKRPVRGDDDDGDDGWGGDDDRH
ncbi:hypothetical protein CPB86DRAFT_868656 [Serendipita vermifera]|nr:hypothetical protein CPB86DRAFT_868656 [Serendipita vermifera]